MYDKLAGRLGVITSMVLTKPTKIHKHLKPKDKVDRSPLLICFLLL